jgi:two-component system, cell cycle response regulator DivK
VRCGFTWVRGRASIGPSDRSLPALNIVEIIEASRTSAGLGGQVPQQLYEATPKTILIVEDNELNMKLFHDLLEAHGYNILQAWDGAEGLTLARRHCPDLIIMDMHLPEISGLDAMKWIKADDDLKAIPIVAVTAFAMKGDKERIRAGGCDAYIAKPVSIRNFIETVELLIR